MNIEQLIQILLTASMYFFGGYIFISYSFFVFRDVAPKVMSGSSTIRDYISFFAGALFILFLLAFGPYYIGTAMLYGWNSFKPLVVTITEDIVEDFSKISTGQGVEVTVPETAPIVQPTRPQYEIVGEGEDARVVTATPEPDFDYNDWSPDQAVPTPEP